METLARLETIHSWQLLQLALQIFALIMSAAVLVVQVKISRNLRTLAGHLENLRARLRLLEQTAGG